MLLPACHSLYVTVVMSLSRRYDFNMDYKDISERGSAEGCVEEMPDYLTLRMVSVRAKTSLQIKRVNRVRPILRLSFASLMFARFSELMNIR